MAKQTDSTTVFKADITDFKASMQEAARLVRLANSEFKASTAGMDDWSSSADGLSAKIKQLNTTLDAQKRQLTVLETEYRKVASEQGEDSRAAQELQIRINNQKASIASTESQLSTYEKKLDDVENETDDVSEASQKASDGFTVLKGVIANLASEAIKMAVEGLKDLGKEVLQTGIAFESSMAKVSALSGATGDDLKLLTDTAREYGATTQFSASEAADALGYMALAGWDAQRSASELGGILNLAASSGMGLAEASDMVTDYLSAFSNSAMTATEFADKLAYAQANSNTSTTQLGEAFKNSAANLNASGQDVETVISLLSAMANQGLKGRKAGTALAATMRDITNAMTPIVDEASLVELGLEGMNDMIGSSVIEIGDEVIAVSDASGNFRDLTDILADVEKTTKSMGDAEKASALSSVFTSDSIKALNLILNDGVSNASDFEEELRNCTGSAEEMAKIMNANLAGDLKSMNSAFEEFKLTVYDSVSTPLRGMAGTITKSILPALTDLVNGVDGAGESLGTAVGGLLTQALDFLVSGLPEFFKIGAKLVSTLAIGLVQSIPDIITAVIDIVKVLLDTLGELIPQLVLGIAKAIPKVISALLGALPEIIRALFSLVSNIVSALPEIIGELLKAIPVIILAFVNALFDGYTAIFEGATELFKALVQALVDILPIIISVLPDVISGLMQAMFAFSPELLKAGVELFSAIVEAIPIITEALIQALPDLIITFVTALVDNFPLLLECATTLFWAIVDAIPIVVQALVENVPKIVMAIVEGLQNLADKLSPYLYTAWEAIKNWAVSAWNTAKEYAPIILSAILDFVNSLPEKIGYFLGLAVGKIFTFSRDAKEKAREAGEAFRDSLIEFFKELPQKIGEFLLKVIQKMPEFISNLKAKAKEGAEGFSEKITSVISELPNKMVTLGKNVVEGLWNGIKDSIGWIQGKIGEFSDGFLGGFKKALGIASPSKVFRDEVGKWIALGISEGFEGEIPDALKDMQKSAKGLVSGLKKELQIPLSDIGLSADSVKNVQSISGASASGGSGAGTSNAGKAQTIVFNQYNTSPKALDRLSIYRDTNSMLFSAKVRVGNV